MRRSRSSTRWETNGCSVPASSSGSLSGPPLTCSRRRARWAEARHPRGTRLGLGADAVLLLVPLRHGAPLQAPVLLRPRVLRRQRRHAGVLTAVQRQLVAGGLPRALQVGRRLLDLARDRLLDVAGSVLELRLHLLEL